MSRHYTFRAIALAGLIALGSAATSEPAGNPILRAAHMLVLESAGLMASVARRGLDGVVGAFRQP